MILCKPTPLQFKIFLKLDFREIPFWLDSFVNLKGEFNIVGMGLVDLPGSLWFQQALRQQFLKHCLETLTDPHRSFFETVRVKWLYKTNVAVTEL